MPFALASMTSECAKDLAVMLELRDKALCRLRGLCPDVNPDDFVGMPPQAGATGVLYLPSSVAFHPLGLNLWLTFIVTAHSSEPTLTLMDDEEVASFVEFCRRDRPPVNRAARRSVRRS